MYKVNRRKSIHRDERSPSPTTPVQNEVEDDLILHDDPSEEHNETESDSENKLLDEMSITDESKKKQMPKDMLLYTALSFVIAVVLGISFASKSDENKICSFDKLKSKYPKQDDYTWKTLSVGIENIINERSDMPGVYLFVHKGEHSMDNLVIEIAKFSSSCFDFRRNPVKMDSEDFASEQDYGYAIEKYKEKVKEGNVILIVNLNKLPAKAAPALHTICDTYSPIAKNVVIFLTLVAQENKGNAVEIAENTLVDLWGSKLDSNELYPLITRVTDQVILLKS